MAVEFRNFHIWALLKKQRVRVCTNCSGQFGHKFSAKLIAYTAALEFVL
jgi:hypothetical protein